MPDTDPEIEILETSSPSLPVGAPPHFRELIALTLKTTNSELLDAAEQDYRGVFTSTDAFIRGQIAEHLPTHLQWLLTCCEPDKLRIGYERGVVHLWSIGLADGHEIVFESTRTPDPREPRPT